MGYNKCDEATKLFLILGLFLGSCYASLLLTCSLLGYGVIAYSGLSPSVIFGASCYSILKHREERSPHKQIGTSTFDDRIFPDDEKREKLIRDFLYRKKPLPWH